MDFFEAVRNLKKGNKKVYIYGAGLYGQNLFKILSSKSIDVDGFVISRREESTVVLGKPIYQITKELAQDAGFIIGVNRHNAIEVKATLDDIGVHESNRIDGYLYIDNYEIRGGYDEIPTMEITTVMGCKVNCRFCPQSTLLDGYYRSDKKRIGVLSIDDFEIYLNKLPIECIVIFSGMAEPFLNKNCGKMIQMACERGHKVNLYTTLEGADLDDILLLRDVGIDFIGLHVADSKGYAKISVSDEYYEKIEKVINLKKSDGTPLISVCNAQTDPDKRVKDICKGKYEILTTMLDRAGNLSEDGLFKKKVESGTISCSICGNKLNHNILLPDGTVLLCCMDYGMQHILGNLNQCSYAELFSSLEYNRVKKGMMNDSVEKILCRHCSCANEVCAERKSGEDN